MPRGFDINTGRIKRVTPTVSDPVVSSPTMMADPRQQVKAAPVAEEVVNLNADPFASTVNASEFATSPKLTESTLYGTQHRFQPKTPELLQAESLIADLDVDFMNEAMGGFKLGPLGSGITPEFLETIEPTLQDKSLTGLGLTREEVNPDVFKDTESFLDFEKKATEEQQEMQLGNLQSLAAEDPTQFGTVWPTIETQDQLRYIDELSVDEDERLNLFAQSLTTHANNLNPETGEPIKQYVVAEGKVWDTGGWGNETFFWETADVPRQKAGQSFDSGGVLEFALNNPFTQIAGMVNPLVGLATTAAKAASGMKVSPMEIASGLLTGLEMSGAIKAPTLDAMPEGQVGTPMPNTGTGLFGTTYAQTEAALNVAAAGDAEGAALALVGDKLITGGLDKVGLDQATIENAGIQYDDFQAGVGKVVSEVAGGADLDDALVQGLGKYIREGGTLGSVDLPSVDLGIDLSGLKDVIKPIVETVEDIGRPIVKLVEDAGIPVVEAVEDVARPVGDIVEDVAQGAGDVLSDLDTAVRQALPDIDLPSVNLNLGGLLTGAGAVAIPQLSATRTTDDLFKDELFKFQTEIGVDVEPLEYVDLNAPAENFFEDPILGRSYNF